MMPPSMGLTKDALRVAFPPKKISSQSHLDFKDTIKCRENVVRPPLVQTSTLVKAIEVVTSQ